ncbi:hypothetical protein D3C80_686690 [compost metagenome]
MRAGGDTDRQAQVFLARQAIEHTSDRLHQRPQADPFRRQSKVPGLNAGDVEYVADQGQQVVGRTVGHFNCRSIQLPLVGFFQG